MSTFASSSTGQQVRTHKCDTGPCHTFLCCHSVDGHPLPIDELKGIKAVESIDLSNKRLKSASAIIIGACIAGNAHLRELKCEQLFKLGGSVTAGALALLKSLIICVRGSLDGNELYDMNRFGGNFTTEGITALCEGLKQSKVSSLR